MKFWQRYDVCIGLIFSASLFAYLLIAYFYFYPQGYYGTPEAPRFADPWIARTETIIGGGLLYRDVFTTTPPLTNLLLIPPSLVPILFGNVNPWATLSYMLWFSLFNLFTALVLLHMGKTKEIGYKTAVLFLLNPLTFGNTVLRRQDESIVVFFIALALYFLVKRDHVKGAVAIGLGLLVKLSAGVLLPVALVHFAKKWKGYLFIPGVVFGAGLAPFLILAGRDAIFWDFGTGGAQHPFQYRGVSLAGLWNQIQSIGIQLPLPLMSALLVLGAGVALAFVAWKKPGILPGAILVVSTVFILSPKLHTGYFSILALLIAPLLRNRQDIILYLTFGGIAVVADYFKWPIVNMEMTFGLMVITLVLMSWLAMRFNRRALVSPPMDAAAPTR